MIGLIQYGSRTMDGRALLQDGGDGPSNELVQAHGALMAISFAIILPVSVVVAATFRNTMGPNTWFQVHRALGIVVMAAIIAGTVLGIMAWIQSQPNVPEILFAHIVIGLIVFGLAVLQAAAAIAARPKQESKLRQWWLPAHQYSGRLVLLIALANAFIGIYAAQEDYSWYVWIAVLWFVIVAVGIGKAIYNRRTTRKAAKPKTANPEAPSAPASREVEVP